MTGLTGQFQTEVPVHEAIVACAEAIDGLGWHIEAVEASRIVSRLDTGSPHPPKIEVVLSESGQATDVRITGTDTDAEPLSEDALIAELDRVRDAIKASLAGATEVPPPGPPPTRQPESAPAPGPTRGRPPSPSGTVARERGRAKRDPNGGRKGMVIGGIIAGLLAIGLGIVGIAIVNDNSEDPKRDLGGKESTGTSLSKQGQGQGNQGQGQGNQGQGQRNQGQGQTNQGQGQTNQGQEPGASGPLGSAETKEIRDGDELLALKPTGVARDGSYITVEIEVAGLGNAGYDTMGLEFRGTLLGSNGQPYRVESSGGPGGCETPKVTLTNGQTLNGCLPFKVPPGVQADRFQYRPFFVGGEAAEWDLE